MPVSVNNFVSPQSLKPVAAVTTAAKTTYNDSTGAVKIATAGANGSILFGLKALPRVTMTANQLQVYRSPDNGTTMYLINSALMAAYTMAQTTAVPITDLGYTETAPLRLAIGDTIWVAMGVAFAAGVAWDAQLEDL